ncbi:hypothetical protein PQQ64_29360 [Paraburkholderia graminis]|uniref:hypothetical protein n=1 Tax=Paraburkholderia graminis TaxID=60548 RepID=UPI0038BBB586
MKYSEKKKLSATKDYCAGHAGLKRVAAPPQRGRFVTSEMDIRAVFEQHKGRYRRTGFLTGVTHDDWENTCRQVHQQKSDGIGVELYSPTHMRAWITDFESRFP